MSAALFRKWFFFQQKKQLAVDSSISSFEWVSQDSYNLVSLVLSMILNGCFLSDSSVVKHLSERDARNRFLASQLIPWKQDPTYLRIRRLIYCDILFILIFLLASFRFDQLVAYSDHRLLENQTLLFFPTAILSSFLLLLHAIRSTVVINISRSRFPLALSLLFVPFLTLVTDSLLVSIIFLHERTVGELVLLTAQLCPSSYSVGSLDTFGPSHPRWTIIYSSTYNPAKWWIVSFAFSRLIWSWPISPSGMNSAVSDRDMSIEEINRQRIRTISFSVTRWGSRVLYTAVAFLTLYFAYFTETSNEDVSRPHDTSPFHSRPPSWLTQGMPFNSSEGRPMDWIYQYLLSIGMTVQIGVTSALVNYSFDPSKKILQTKRMKIHDLKRQREEFIQRFSHVARTSLACVRPFSKELRTLVEKEMRSMIVEGRSDLNLKRSIRILNASEDAAVVLVDRLVHFYSLRSSTIRLNSSRCDLIQIVKDVIAAEEIKQIDSMDERRVVSEVNVSFVSNVEFLWIQSDRNYIHLVLTNILSNAVKYSARGQKNRCVAVRLEHLWINALDDGTKKEIVRIEVRDNGVGMTLNELRKARGETIIVTDDENETKKKTNAPKVLSAGIGLGIVRALNRLFGGELSFHSNGPNQGTTVCWEIPLDVDVFHRCDGDNVEALSDDSNDEEFFGDESKTSDFSNLRVVLAEDNSILQKIYRYRLMTILGVEELTIVSNGMELVDYCKQHQDELLMKRVILIVDINMPVMCGDLAVEKIRQIDGFESVPIFACTATVRQQTVKEYCEVHGFTGLYEKPLTIEEYTEMVARGSRYYSDGEEEGDYNRSFSQLSQVSRSFSLLEPAGNDLTAPPGTLVALLRSAVMLNRFFDSVRHRWRFGSGTAPSPEEKTGGQDDDNADAVVRTELDVSLEDLQRQRLRQNHGHLLAGIAAGISVCGLLTILYLSWNADCLLIHACCELLIGPLILYLFRLVSKIEIDDKFYPIFGIGSYLFIWGLFHPWELSPKNVCLTYIMVMGVRNLRGFSLLFFFLGLCLVHIVGGMLSFSWAFQSSLLRNGALGYIWSTSWWLTAYALVNRNLFGKVDEEERDSFALALQEDLVLTRVQDRIISRSVHDLRNQVGGMTWAIGDILESAAGIESIGDVGRTLFSSLSFFSEGCEQLTEYFRFKNGRLLLVENSRCSLHSLLRCTIDRELEWSYFHQKSGAIEFDMNLDAVPLDLQVCCDQIRLRSIVGNLISNSIKFTAQGRISVVCGVSEAKKAPSDELARSVILSVRVTDTGRGMTNEKIQEISVDPFEGCSRLEIDSSLSVGFGVFVHMEVAKMMGGSLEYHQNENGVGITALLSVQLDLSVIEKDEFRADSVLVVDDQLSIQMMLSRLISQLGVSHVDVASNVSEARALLRENEYDGALLDVHLGRERGLDLIDGGEEGERLTDVVERVVLMTGSQIHEWKEFVEDHGLYDAYQKPLYEDELATILGLEN